MVGLIIRWYIVRCAFRLGGRAVHALARQLVRLARAAAYLICLLAVHLTVAVAALLSFREAERGHVGQRSDALLVGMLAAVLWEACVTVPVWYADGLGLGFWMRSAAVLPIAAVAGWQLRGWREARFWARRPRSLVLGTWRTPAFHVAQPYVVPGQERLKHLAVHGPTGSGKSTLLKNLILSDMRAGAGICVIDPKDDLVDAVLPHIPIGRERDVILWDATDTDWPLGFNPLGGVPADRRTLAASELVAVFRRYFQDSWGARLEHILSNVILALLETPGSTLLDVPRLLLEPPFREWVLRHVTNPGVRHFLLVEFEQVLRRRGDAVEPILNKVGPWLAYPELRNTIGQARSSFDCRQIMDRGQILLVRIPQGSLGEDVSSLLGALLVAKVQLAAHSRVNVAPERRRPFYLYADEFQNFATSSFARILTEARGFGLGLVCANQYREQLSRDLQFALARNVATTAHCRYRQGRYLLEVSRLEETADDVPPVIVAPPPPLEAGDPSRSARIRIRARAAYGRPRDEVEGQTAAGAPSPAGSRKRAARLSVATGMDIDEE